MYPFEFGAAKFVSEHFDTASGLMRFGGCSAGAAAAAGLALGWDIDLFFENTLQIYEPCKYVPFGMCGGVKRVVEGMSASGGGDAAWRERGSGRLAVGVSAVRMTGCSWALEPEQVSEFRDAAHAVEIIRASCHLPLIGGVLPYRVAGHAHGFYDGGLTMLVPEAPDTPEAGGGSSSSGSSFDINVTIDQTPDNHRSGHSGRGRSGRRGTYVMPSLGFKVPDMWCYVPRPPPVLREIFRLGYLKTAEAIFSAETLEAVRHVMRPSVDPSDVMARVHAELPHLTATLRRRGQKNHRDSVDSHHM
jgi:predicted acylesterase/phospholipase RssA